MSDYSDLTAYESGAERNAVCVLRIVPFTPAAAKADPYVEAVAGNPYEQGASA